MLQLLVGLRPFLKCQIPTRKLRLGRNLKTKLISPSKPRGPILVLCLAVPTTTSMKCWPLIHAVCQESNCFWVLQRVICSLIILKYSVIFFQTLSSRYLFTVKTSKRFDRISQFSPRNMEKTYPCLVTHKFDPRKLVINRLLPL